MSVVAGPKVVTDGLVACYDPGNKLSYSGSGTTLKDLVGNYNATIDGSPAFNERAVLNGQPWSANTLTLRFLGDHGGQIADLPNASMRIPSSAFGIYFNDSDLFDANNGSFNNDTDILYILHPDGSLFLKLDTTGQNDLSGGGGSTPQAVWYTTLEQYFYGLSGDSDTAEGRRFHASLNVATGQFGHQDAFKEYINPYLVSSGETREFKVNVNERPFISNVKGKFTFDGINDDITLGGLPLTQEYTYEFIFSPVDYTAAGNNYQRMLISSTYSNFIVLEENRIFRHRVPGVDNTGNLGNEVVFETDQFHMATFSYNQSVSKNYKNGVLLNSRSVGSGTVTAGTLSLFTSGAINQYQGDFVFFRAYNRALTDAEVLQNYNALKGRFGL